MAKIESSRVEKRPDRVGTELTKWLSGTAWVSLFLVGLATAFAIWFSGFLAPKAYDATVVPILYEVVFPRRWIILGLLVGLSCLRPEGKPEGANVTDRRVEIALLPRNVAGYLLGLWFGLVLVNDWWYFSPWLALILVGVVAWRMRWLLWAERGAVLIVTLAVPGLVVAGAGLDFEGGWFRWDNRFGFGFTHIANREWTFALLGILALVAAYWGAWYWLMADVRHRSHLVNLIQREPRCSRYFDLVARLTQFQGSRSKRPGRFHNCAELRDAGTAPAVFPPAAAQEKTGWIWRVLVRFDTVAAVPIDFLTAWVRWLAVWGAGRAWIARSVRFLRSPQSTPGLASQALRDLLAEGVGREHRAWLDAWLPRMPREGTPPPLFTMLLQRNRAAHAACCAEADLRFARYVALREAQIEANHYLFLSVPDLVSAESVENPKGIHDQEVWRKVATEYLALWHECLGWRFVRRGAHFMDPAEEGKDAVDLVRITQVLLACRRAGRANKPSAHEKAADTALGLLTLNPERGASDASWLTQTYFDLQRLLPHLSPLHQLIVDVEKPGMPRPDAQSLSSGVLASLSEAGLACVSYGLWQLSRGNWTQATRPLALSRGTLHSPKVQPLAVAGTALQISAVAKLVQLKGVFSLGANAALDDLPRDFVRLDGCQPPQVLFDGACRGSTLTCVFAWWADQEFPPLEPVSEGVAADV